MPVPQSWNDLSVIPASNSPAGGEAVGTQMDDYLRSHAAFIKQLHDGWIARDGTVAMTGALNMGGQKITSVGAPSASTDGANKGYVDGALLALLPRGAIIMWWGQPGTIPAGWVACDGTNGTPDMRDRVPYGMGGSYANLAYGGSNTIALTVNQMPTHTHSVYDPGHAHGISDPGHAHGVNDPGHQHSMPKNSSAQAGSDNNGMPIACDVPYYSTTRNPLPTNGAGTGISIYGSGTGIGINGAATGVSLYNTGGSAAIDIRQSFTVMYFIMKA